MLELNNILYYPQGVILLGLIALFVQTDKMYIKYTFVGTTIFAFLSGIYVLCFFSKNIPTWQFLTKPLIEFHFITFRYGVDSISIILLILTLFIFPLCALYIWNVQHKIKFLTINLLILEFMVIGLFLTTNLLFFYIYFEFTFIPMMFLIGVWGPRRQRIKANYYFIGYTLIGSIFFIFGLLLIYAETGTSDIILLSQLRIAPKKELIIWVCLFIPFAIKIPIMPFHIWLPEAHVEAPTVGSVILASLLLKIGGYGILRFLVFLLPTSTQYFTPVVSMLCIISFIYSTFIALTQTDAKRIVAYSSIAHMAGALLAIFSLTTTGIQGSIIMWIGHAFVSGGLFFLIGMLYERYGAKAIFYFGGLIQPMPIFTLFLFFFIIANIALPGTVTFIGEILIIVGVFKKNVFAVIVILIGSVGTLVYSIWIFTQLCFGTLKTDYIKKFKDLTLREVLILSILAFFIIVLGLYPTPVLDFTSSTISYNLVLYQSNL